jgi:hypothetical protein
MNVETSPLTEKSQVELTDGETKKDTISELNIIFRSLYGRNRDAILDDVPLAGLTLIGTGEIWRVEYGKLVKSYQPIKTIPNIKGLMHSILGAYAVNAILQRKNTVDGSKIAGDLGSAFEIAIERIPLEIPEELELPTLVVVRKLKQLTEAWEMGCDLGQTDFSEALRIVSSELEYIIKAVGEISYHSLTQSFQSFKQECSPDEWDNCIIGVCGPGQGRRDNIEIASAMTIMGKEALGCRLLYLENALTIPDGLKFLAAAIVEKDLSQAVFGEPYRMWRDLFSEAATKYVGYSFFPELGPSRIL